MMSIPSRVVSAVVAVVTVAVGPVAAHRDPGHGLSPPRLKSECDDSDPTQSVRPRDATASILVQFGRDRSQTFRDLLADLRRSDVIVYVDVHDDPANTEAGTLRFIGGGNGVRFVMATVETGTSRPAAVQENLVALTATLGHELQHAREVADTPSIRSVADFETHYRAVGTKVHGNSLDTEAARHIGLLVERELVVTPFKVALRCQG